MDLIIQSTDVCMMLIQLIVEKVSAMEGLEKYYIMMTEITTKI